MKKSEAALSFVLYTKAQDLEIDPVLFHTTINYIIANPKSHYDKDDLLSAVALFVSVLDEHIRSNRATMKPIFQSLDKQKYVSMPLLHFAEKYKTNDFLNYVFQNCKNELRVVIDYKEMGDTGFTEQEILNLIEKS